MTDTKKNKGGRPSFKPTDEQRKTVRAMIAYGVPQADVCEVIGVTDKTLRKHFDRELRTAATEANAKVAQALYKQAVDQGNTTAQIFWLKTKAGWKDTTVHEHSGPNGGPIQTEAKIDPSGLSDSTLAELMAARKGDT
jgi:hypothetical protein